MEGQNQTADVRFTCTFEGCDRTFNSAKATKVHLSKAHGVKGRSKHVSRAQRASQQASEWEGLASDLLESGTIEEANAVLDRFSRDEYDCLKEEMESWRENLDSTLRN